MAKCDRCGKDAVKETEKGLVCDACGKVQGVSTSDSKPAAVKKGK